MNKPKWIPLDKELVYLLPKDRPYSHIEAMFSYTLDRDNKKENSIAGYAKLWGWSRNKVRSFLNISLNKMQGQVKDSLGTLCGQGFSFVDSALWVPKDSVRTGRGQGKDSTIDPNPNPNPKTKEKKHIYGEYKNVFLTDKQYEKLKVDYNGQLDDMFKKLDEGIQLKGYKYKDHNLAIRKWFQKNAQRERLF